MSFLYLFVDSDTAEYLYDALTAEESSSDKEITAQAIRGALEELGDTPNVYEERVATVWAMIRSRL